MVSKEWIQRRNSGFLSVICEQELKRRDIWLVEQARCCVWPFYGLNCAKEERSRRHWPYSISRSSLKLVYSLIRLSSTHKRKRGRSTGDKPTRSDRRILASFPINCREL